MDTAITLSTPSSSSSKPVLVPAPVQIKMDMRVDQLHVHRSPVSLIGIFFEQAASAIFGVSYRHHFTLCGSKAGMASNQTAVKPDRHQSGLPLNRNGTYLMEKINACVANRMSANAQLRRCCAPVSFVLQLHSISASASRRSRSASQHFRFSFTTFPLSFTAFPFQLPGVSVSASRRLRFSFPAFPLPSAATRKYAP